MCSAIDQPQIMRLTQSADGRQVQLALAGLDLLDVRHPQLVEREEIAMSPLAEQLGSVPIGWCAAARRRRPCRRST
jgi:hypothetical protein